MIRPGIAPIYVRRWPRISLSSCKPPSEIRPNLRPKAVATERPSEVLPTPGGPYKHKIGDFKSPLSLITAKCSKIRSLTSSKPKWSSSNCLRAHSKSRLSLVTSFHGSSNINCKYVICTEYSATAGFKRSTFASSFSKSSPISFGQFFFLAASRICSISASAVSPNSS